MASYLEGGELNILRFLNGVIQKRNTEHEHDKTIENIYHNTKIKSLDEFSFAQYLCQQEVYQNKYKLTSMFPLLFLLQLVVMAVLFFFALFGGRGKKQMKNKKVLAVLPSEDMLPLALKDNYEFSLRQDLKFNFNFNDFYFCLKIFNKYFSHPYFVIKSVYICWLYSKAAKEYGAVCVSNEYSFTSSILTSYFNFNDVTSINCMHGEKCYDAVDAFCCFDFFYVWDEHYEKLMTSMHCKAKFIISNCDMLLLDLSAESKDRACYLLQGEESLEELSYVRDNLIKIAADYNLKYISVKPHPIYLTPNLLDVFDESEVYTEANLEVLKESYVVCGKFSTVLFQVYVSRVRGVPLIALFSGYYKHESDYVLTQKADIFV